MDFNVPCILEDDFVQLRPLELDDYDRLLPFALNEPDIWRFNSRGAAGAAGLADYIANALAQRAKGIEYPFIVYDKVSGSYAGSTRYYDIKIPFSTLEIGFTWYGNAYQGTGLNKHCKYLLLHYAFEQLNMERVAFKANNANEPSKAAMRSIGCIDEGVLRNASTNAAGERIDVIVLSIVRSDWFGGVKEKLAAKLRV